ncbi:Unknown protein [Striga hermonthica]|uniref:Uncharacterized protein n=1 Tax=Striga hermonthica TaxID=68872 RepID=A0A9N7RDQ5_STRHE|nr:Unknown protein [Striga hermonthica]
MTGNLKGALKEEWNTEDLTILTSKLKGHESLIRLKRRWLMDLPLSVNEKKKVEEMLPPEDKVLPESLIREDDVSYEDIRTAIEMGFGVHSYRKERQCTQEDVQVLNACECLQQICFLLDDMSTRGLCSIIEVLTGGMINFEKTNLSMKRTIKELLPKLTANRNNISKIKLKQISKLLKDPENFKGGQLLCLTASEAYRAAAIVVIDRLMDLPARALLAMRRKLDGAKTCVPSLRPERYDSRQKLCKRLKKRMDLLLDFRDGDEPAEELARALGVAGLTLKLIMKCSDVRDFRKFSPEIEALQNDIAKAIHLTDISISDRMSLIELEKVQVLLDPNLELSVNRLRECDVRDLLTEYLFECSDMDRIPDSLVKTVNLINTRSQIPSLKKRLSSKSRLLSPQELMRDAIQKEVEHVLTVSALGKEVVLNFIPEHEFDADFSRAYLEDFGGNNNFLCISDDEGVGCYELHSSNSYDGKSESIGETSLVKRTSKRDDGSSQTDGVSDCWLSCKESKVADSSDNANGFKSEEATSCCYSTNPNCVSSEFLLETDIVSGSCNKYLHVQEACDASSMVAYRYVGCLLEKLANIEKLELCKVDRLYLRG